MSEQKPCCRCHQLRHCRLLYLLDGTVDICLECAFTVLEENVKFSIDEFVAII